ncbi:hypothetical protein [Chryseobacterium sp. MP_3.2]|uniref:hypothetical protein n=1 Tax=Chryseobacterium sp. MP_3.2 TaxID=3071712 RepID=UPI002E032711|nr:hypothetical protein [Chryseobacterium sp. MP_3.2]
MKKTIFILGAVSFLTLVSCKKTETTDMNSGVDSTASVVIVDNDSMPITTDSTVNEADNAAERAVDATGAAIKEGAEDVKDAAKDATDGDGNITK